MYDRGEITASGMEVAFLRYWAMYAACTALIVFSGAKLSRYGDILAGKTGLGRTWIGVVLMDWHGTRSGWWPSTW